MQFNMLQSELKLDEDADEDDEDDEDGKLLNKSNI